MILNFFFAADADRIIHAGGVYLNQQRVSDPELRVGDAGHILPNGITLVRVGQYYLQLASQINL